MTLIQLGIIVLIVAGVAIYFAPKLAEWRERIKDRVQPVVCVPSQATNLDERLRVLKSLTAVIRELEAVGAKSAATRLKGVAATAVTELFEAVQ